MVYMMRRRRVVVIAIYAALLGGGWFLGDILMNLVSFEVKPQNEAKLHAMIMIAVATFVVASAAPFVPGAEIGFGLIVLFGAKIAVLVYTAMVSALVLSFLIGRFVPPRCVAAVFGYLGLTRARDLVLGMALLDAQGRLALLASTAPRRVLPKLLAHRYLALIVLFNLPGNSAIGGGGGIAFTAGLSGLFAFPAYLGVVLVAVAPVPLFFVVRQAVA